MIVTIHCMTYIFLYLLETLTSSHVPFPVFPGERLLCGRAHLRGLSLRKAAMGGGLAAKRRALRAGTVV